MHKVKEIESTSAETRRADVTNKTDIYVQRNIEARLSNHCVVEKE